MKTDKPLDASVETSAVRESAERPQLGPGVRVRYRYTHRMRGTIVRRHRGIDSWYVMWQDGQMRQAYGSNLDIEESPLQSRENLKEGASASTGSSEK